MPTLGINVSFCIKLNTTNVSSLYQADSCSLLSWLGLHISHQSSKLALAACRVQITSDGKREKSLPRHPHQPFPLLASLAQAPRVHLPAPAQHRYVLVRCTS